MSDNFRKMLDTNIVVPLWPVVGQALNMGRGATFQAARDGRIKTLDFVGKKKMVSVAWLRQKLGIDD
jgi:hypothetical protein